MRLLRWLREHFRPVAFDPLERAEAEDIRRAIDAARAAQPDPLRYRRRKELP